MVRDEENDHCENHQVRVEQQKHSGVVEAPTALEATAGFAHSPGGNQQDNDLPGRAMESFDMGESREMQARNERGKDSTIPRTRDRCRNRKMVKRKSTAPTTVDARAYLVASSISRRASV